MVAIESGALPPHCPGAALPSGSPPFRQPDRASRPVFHARGTPRDNSKDSRFIGLIDRSQVVGRVDRVVLPLIKNHSYLPFDRQANLIADFPSEGMAAQNGFKIRRVYVLMALKAERQRPLMVGTALRCGLTGVESA